MRSRNNANHDVNTSRIYVGGGGEYIGVRERVGGSRRRSSCREFELLSLQYSVDRDIERSVLGNKRGLGKGVLCEIDIEKV